MPVDYKKIKIPLIFSNCHIQTMLPSLVRKVNFVFNGRVEVKTFDDDFFDLDYSLKGKKAVLILHGLEGSASRGYVRGMAKKFFINGYSVFAINFRGCSGRINKKLQTYHSGFTADLLTCVNYIFNNFDVETLSFMGFSMGGSILLNFLGREKNINNRIANSVAVSVPVDLAGSANRLSRKGNFIYTVRFLKMLYNKLKEKEKLFPGQLDLSGYDKIKNLVEFDNRYTSKIFGFKDANDYYLKASSKPFLKNIKKKVTIINSMDDPFLSSECFPVEEAVSNENINLIITDKGGHVGFYNPLRDFTIAEEIAFEFVHNKGGK